VNTERKLSFIALTPLILFVLLFLSSVCIMGQAISTLFACFIAVIYAITCTFTSDVSLNKRIELFILGSAQHTALATCYILYLSAIFTYVVDLIGGTKAAVAIGMSVLPTHLILPGFFSLVSLFAVAIGSSMGAIAAFLPIGLGITTKISVDPALMCGLVVGGAMLGDNLSIISDTTIAATQTTHCKMSDKFKANFFLVLPAFCLTIFVLSFINKGLTVNTEIVTTGFVSFWECISVLPYAIVFFLAPLNIDVMAILTLGIGVAMGIGIWQGILAPLQATGLLLKGFSANESIQEVFILVLFVAGLSYLVEYNGGITYLIDRFSHKIKTKTSAEISIIFLVFFVNMAVAINTIAILVTGPVAKHIADQFGIKKQRVASLIDIVACICQGILPYAPQLLLAASLAKISPIIILPYLHYQWFIALITIVSVGITYISERND
jgi:Na+/H+ antiporter NhaC